MDAGTARTLLAEGIAPIYFVEIPGWNDKAFDALPETWIPIAMTP